MAGDEADLGWLDALTSAMHDNSEERVNLQKALFEVEDARVQNASEVRALDSQLRRLAERPPGAAGAAVAASATVALAARRSAVAESLRENAEESRSLRKEIAANEEARRQLDARIDSLLQGDRSHGLVRVLRQYRLQGLTNLELHFQLAVRDQVISNLKAVVGNLWRVFDAAGMDNGAVLQLARSHGILVDAVDAAESWGSPPAPRPGDGRSLSLSPPRQRGEAPSVKRLSDGEPRGAASLEDQHRSAVSGARAKARFDFWARYERTHPPRAELGDTSLLNGDSDDEGGDERGWTFYTASRPGSVESAGPSAGPIGQASYVSQDEGGAGRRRPISAQSGSLARVYDAAERARQQHIGEMAALHSIGSGARRSSGAFRRRGTDVASSRLQGGADEGGDDGAGRRIDSGRRGDGADAAAQAAQHEAQQAAILALKQRIRRPSLQPS